MEHSVKKLIFYRFKTIVRIRKTTKLIIIFVIRYTGSLCQVYISTNVGKLVLIIKDFTCHWFLNDIFLIIFTKIIVY